MYYQKVIDLKFLLGNNENDKCSALNNVLAEVRKQIQELEKNQ